MADDAFLFLMLPDGRVEDGIVSPDIASSTKIRDAPLSTAGEGSAMVGYIGIGYAGGAFG